MIARFVAWRLRAGAPLIGASAVVAIAAGVELAHDEASSPLLVVIIALIFSVLGLIATLAGIDVDGSLRQGDMLERLPLSSGRTWIAETSAAVAGLFMIVAPAIVVFGALHSSNSGKGSAHLAVLAGGSALLGFGGGAFAAPLALPAGGLAVAVACVPSLAVFVATLSAGLAWRLAPGSLHHGLVAAIAGAILVLASAVPAILAPPHASRGLRNARIVLPTSVACVALAALSLQLQARWWLSGAAWTAADAPQVRDLGRRSPVLGVQFATRPAGERAFLLARAGDPHLRPVPEGCLFPPTRGDTPPEGDLIVLACPREPDGWTISESDTVALLDPATGSVQRFGAVERDEPPHRVNSYWSAHFSPDRSHVAVRQTFKDEQEKKAHVLRILRADGSLVRRSEIEAWQSVRALRDGRFVLQSVSARGDDVVDLAFDPRTGREEELLRPARVVSREAGTQRLLFEQSSRLPDGQPCLDLVLRDPERAADVPLLGASCVVGAVAESRPGPRKGPDETTWFNRGLGPSAIVSWRHDRAALLLRRAESTRFVHEIWSCDLAAATCSVVMDATALPGNALLTSGSATITRLEKLFPDGRIAWRAEGALRVIDPLTRTTTLVARDPADSSAWWFRLSPDGRSSVVELGGFGEPSGVVVWSEGQELARLDGAEAASWLDDRRFLVRRDSSLDLVTISGDRLSTTPILP